MLTWRMAQGVTMMMNISDTALRDLTTLAVVSASRLSLMGRLATEEPSNIGSADSSMCLMINFEIMGANPRDSSTRSDVIGESMHRTLSEHLDMYSRKPALSMTHL